MVSRSWSPDRGLPHSGLSEATVHDTHKRLPEKYNQARLVSLGDCYFSTLHAPDTAQSGKILAAETGQSLPTLFFY